MNDNFKNKHLPLSDYNVVVVNKTGINKYRYKIQRKDDSINAAKYKASTELDNLLKAAEYSYHAKDIKNHSFAAYGFDYYTVKFVVGGQMFEGRLDIGVSPKGATFYGMNKIKRVTESTMVLANLVLEDTQSSHRNSLNTNNISQNDTVVNDNISENGESDTKLSLKEDFKYDELIKKPDIKVVKIKNTLGSDPTRTDVKNEALKNAKRIGKTNNKGETSVYVSDIGKDVVINRAGIEHSLNRRYKPRSNIIASIGDILSNSIEINRLKTRNENTNKFSRVLLGVSEFENNIYIVKSTIDVRNSNLNDIEVLYGVSSKQKRSGVQNTPGVSMLPTTSEISVSQLLDIVKDDYRHLLSADVLDHFNLDRDYSTDKGIANDLLYSLKEDVDKIQGVAYNNTKTLREHHEYDDFMPSGAMGKEIRNRIIQSFTNKDFGNEAAIVDFYFNDYRMTVSYVSPTNYKLIDFHEIDDEKRRNIHAEYNGKGNDSHLQGQRNGAVDGGNDDMLPRNRGTAEKDAQVSQSQSERNSRGYSGRTDVHNGQTETTEAGRVDEDVKFSVKESEKYTFVTTVKKLDNISKETKNNLKMRNIAAIETEQQLDSAITNALNNKNDKLNYCLGAIDNDTLIKISQNINKDIFKTGQYAFVVSNDDIRHISEHFKDTPSIKQAIYRLCDVIKNYDSVDLTSYNGESRLVFKKNYNDYNYLSVEVVSNKRKSLNLKTFYVTKNNKKGVQDYPPANTSKSGELASQRVSYSSNNNISQNDKVVNNSISENGENDTKFSLKEDVDNEYRSLYNEEKPIIVSKQKYRRICAALNEKLATNFAYGETLPKYEILLLSDGVYRVRINEYGNYTVLGVYEEYAQVKEQEEFRNDYRNSTQDHINIERNRSAGRRYGSNTINTENGRTARENVEADRRTTEREANQSGSDRNGSQSSEYSKSNSIKKYSLLDDVEIEKAKKAYERNRKLQADTKLVRKLFKDAGTVLDKSKTDAIADTLAKRYEVKDTELKSLLKDKLYAYYTYAASEDASDAQIALYSYEIAQDIATMSEEIAENPSNNFFAEYGESIYDVISLDIAREYAEKAIIKAPKDLEQEHKKIADEYRKAKDSGEDTKAIYKELKDKTDELIKARKQYEKSRSEIVELRELLRKTKRAYERKVEKRAFAQKNERMSGSEDNRGKSSTFEALTNAVGKPIIKVKYNSLIGKPNSITQKTNSKGGVDRNYYDENGNQMKQISNNDHGHKVESEFGNHGEHAHDYHRDHNGKLKHGKARELTYEERKENLDIL